MKIFKAALICALLPIYGHAKDWCQDVQNFPGPQHYLKLECDDRREQRLKMLEQLLVEKELLLKLKEKQLEQKEIHEYHCGEAAKFKQKD